MLTMNETAEKQTQDGMSVEAKFTLREMRTNAGFRPVEILPLCDITYHTLRSWEAGKTVPNVVDVAEMLQIYGYKLEDLELAPYYKHRSNTARPGRKPQRPGKKAEIAQEKINEIRRQYDERKMPEYER